MSIFISAFLIGVIAGLRSMTAPAAVSWAARLGWLNLEDTALSFLGLPITSIILSLLAAGELVADKLPKTPSRKGALGFTGRLITGGLSGAAIGASEGALILGLLAGVLGAVAGTYGGYELRVRLAGAIGKDLPAALLEDLIAVGGAALLMMQVGQA